LLLYHYGLQDWKGVSYLSSYFLCCPLLLYPFLDIVFKPLDQQLISSFPGSIELPLRPLRASTVTTPLHISRAHAWGVTFKFLRQKIVRRRTNTKTKACYVKQANDELRLGTSNLKDKN
jgi:hypothetical protein